MKKFFFKFIDLVIIFLMIISQLGSVQLFSEIANADNTSNQKVYHDYDEYQKALTKYTQDYNQYEQKLNEYNQKKQEYDNLWAEAERIEKENAEKRATYEEAKKQYEKDLEEYNIKQQEVAEHSAKGQYIGPDFFSIFLDVESYAANYAIMKQLMETGLSINGDPLKDTVKNNIATNPFSGNPDLETNIQKVIDQWNIYVDFVKSIGGEGDTLVNGTLDVAINGIKVGEWYDSKGVEFYHTFSSSTGQTADNVPTILDHPTEDNIKKALNDLFGKTGGISFDAASMNMQKNTFMVDQSMVNKWFLALEEAKQQGLNLYRTAIEKYIQVFEKYNNSNYEIADFAAFKAGQSTVKEMLQEASKLIIGKGTEVELEDQGNSAPFYNDLKNLSVSDIK